MQPLFPDIGFPLCGGVLSIEKDLAVHGDAPGVRRLEEVQAAQQSGLARAGGTYDAKRLPLLEGKADVV